MFAGVKDYALLKKEDGTLLFGEGPFQELKQCPEDGVAFYVNDFALSDPAPWKVPSQVKLVKSISELELELGISDTDIEVNWDELGPDGFARIFSEINQAISKGEIEKSVPVAVEKGTFQSGRGRDLVRALHSDEAFYPYAWVQGDKGFCGLTPEVLFNFRKGRLNTMALAGTARSSEQQVFAYDEKEIREHEFVAQTLVSKLSDVGMVTRSKRSILDLGVLVHFHTPIEVFLYGDKNIEDLVKRLHPTPALGPLPRTEETVSNLIQWREILDCPAFFGAPFGVFDHGEFHAVVTIRGVHWNEEQVEVPSGCGVIEASRLVNEWRELELKRSAVKSSFGIE